VNGKVGSDTVAAVLLVAALYGGRRHVVPNGRISLVE